MFKQYLAAAVMSAAVLAPLSVANAQDGSMGGARAAAIHACSVLAQRYPETTFASTEFELYRACMAGHGQVE